VREFLARKGITVLDHPPYSPHLGPADFWFFPKVKLVMKGDCHDTIQDIQRGFHKRSTVTAFKNFSIDSSNVLIQRETILNKKSEILKIIHVLYV
jgi:hypothetical protein